ncbi:MAG: prephenate dehydrogenase [Actinomycetota bacterium]
MVKSKPMGTGRTVSRSPTHQVGIVGLGAIGASIGLSLRSAGIFAIGFDRSLTHLRRALDMGAISRAVTGPDELTECREVFVAVPPAAVVTVVRNVLALTDATVLDVASVKADIVRAILSPRFVPSHPLRGTHLSGPDAARGDLFAGALWVTCPVSTTDPAALEDAEHLIRLTGADPLRMTAAEHDSYLATTSHLPHVAASGLVNVLGSRDPAARRLVAGGFLDTTRIARANPELWAEITWHNRTEVSGTISELIKQLSSVKEALDEGNRSEVLAYFTDASQLMEWAMPTNPPDRAPGSTIKPALRTRTAAAYRHRHQVVTELGGAH